MSRPTIGDYIKWLSTTQDPNEDLINASLDNALITDFIFEWAEDN